MNEEFVAQKAAALAAWSAREEWGSVIALGQTQVGLERVCQLYMKRCMSDDGCADLSRLTAHEQERLNALTTDLVVIWERLEELRRGAVRNGEIVAT